MMKGRVQDTKVISNKGEYGSALINKIAAYY